MQICQRDAIIRTQKSWDGKWSMFYFYLFKKKIKKEFSIKNNQIIFNKNQWRSFFFIITILKSEQKLLNDTKILIAVWFLLNQFNIDRSTVSMSFWYQLFMVTVHMRVTSFLSCLNFAFFSLHLIQAIKISHLLSEDAFFKICYIFSVLLLESLRI